jgi:archaellum component FlaC
MATEKTPPQKRIKRAEEGRDNWKVKASKRREECEKLKLELIRKDERLDQQSIEINEMKKKMASVNKMISKYQHEIEELKKKL